MRLLDRFLEHRGRQLAAELREALDQAVAAHQRRAAAEHRARVAEGRADASQQSARLLEEENERLRARLATAPAGPRSKCAVHETWEPVVRAAQRVADHPEDPQNLQTLRDAVAVLRRNGRDAANARRRQ